MYFFTIGFNPHLNAGKVPILSIYIAHKQVWTAGMWTSRHGSLSHNDQRNSPHLWMPTHAYVKNKAYGIDSRARVEFPSKVEDHRCTTFSECAALMMEKQVACNGCESSRSRYLWWSHAVRRAGWLRVAKYCILTGFIIQNGWSTPMKDWDRWEASVWINWRMRQLVEVIQPKRSEQEPGRVPGKTGINKAHKSAQWAGRGLPGFWTGEFACRRGLWLNKRFYSSRF